MELGSLEIQIFVGLVVVLGTAFVALVCDFLKGNNEQLRERNVELRVRQEERDRLGLSSPAQWLQGLAALIRHPALVDAMAASAAAAAGTAPATPVSPAPAMRTAEPPSEPRVTPQPRAAAQPVQPEERSSASRRRYEQERGDRQTSWASKEELEQLAERAARIRARHETSVRRNQAGQAAEHAIGQPAASEPPRLKVLSFERFENRETLDLDEELDRVARDSQPEVQAVVAPYEPVAAAHAVQAPVATLAAGMVEKPAEAVEAATPTEAAVVTATRVDDSPAAGIEPAPAGMLPVFPAVVGAARAGGPAVDSGAQQPLWSAPVVKPEIPPADLNQFVSAASPELETGVFESEVFEEAPATVDAETFTSSRFLMVPAGFQDASVMASLLENQAPYTGVIVAIGINDYDSVREKVATPAGIESLEAVKRMIISMLRQSDFACQFQEDEFLLLFPGETGAAAQRRLFQVSEKLWDFQLRSMGNLALMFSWGGYEVGCEHLIEAIACARERMFQTKRSRKPAPLDLSLFRKRVVNG